jgi:hypothetical protein
LMHHSLDHLPHLSLSLSSIILPGKCEVIY